MSRIAITGSTGLLGEALGASLTEDGHTVVRVVRDATDLGDDSVLWNPAAGEIDASGLEGVDAVVHLAAAPIRGTRWPPAQVQRRQIYESRVVGTTLLAKTLAGLSEPPGVFVSASAVGYYGDRGDEVLTEDSGPGDDFLAEACAAWEGSTKPAASAGIRTVLARTGVVIADGGPLIDKVKIPFKLGVGGRVGDGRQYVPWISLHDHVQAMRMLLDSELSGPVNLVAPEPVTNAELTRAIGSVVRRPTVMPIPLVMMRLLYGEIGEMLAATSARVVPRRLLDAGFTYSVTDIREALAIALDRAA